MSGQLENPSSVRSEIPVASTRNIVRKGTKRQLPSGLRAAVGNPHERSIGQEISIKHHWVIRKSTMRNCTDEKKRYAGCIIDLPLFILSHKVKGSYYYNHTENGGFMKVFSSKSEELHARSCLLRRDVIRATTAAGSGHPTSCLSAADIVATLFFDTMRFNPAEPENPFNDRFILSEGHLAPLLYAAWKQVGEISDEELLSLRKMGSRLEGHPTPRFPYVEAATGSLGQGLSVGVGMACALKADVLPAHIFVLVGDSELSEGSNWEAVQIATHYRLRNLIAVININRLGQRGETLWGYDLEQYKRVFTAFGWRSFGVDGHDVTSLKEVLKMAKEFPGDMPRVVLAKTIKGYGLGASIENKDGYHGKALRPEIAEDALEVLHCIPKIELPYAEDISSRPCETAASIAHFEHAVYPLPPYRKGDKIAPRRAYGEALAALGVAYEQVIALDAEVKNSTYAEIFEKAHPDRFYECFIAEQNMIGMAVGFAVRGKIPFSSTFASFLSRAFDQLRMAAIGRVPLRCAGSHAGVSIGPDGPSQMGLEDMAMMRSLPESVVLYPADAIATWALVGLMAHYEKGISYVRLTRSETPCLYQPNTEFHIGGCHVLRKADDDSCCVIAAGITVHEALRAAENLANEGILIRVIDCYSIKPLPDAVLTYEIAVCNNRVVIVEDHYREGGLGEAIGLMLLAAQRSIKMVHLAVPQVPLSGTSEEQLAYAHIDGNAIACAVKELLTDYPHK